MNRQRTTATVLNTKLTSKLDQCEQKINIQKQKQQKNRISFYFSEGIVCESIFSIEYFIELFSNEIIEANKPTKWSMSEWTYKLPINCQCKYSVC